MSKNQRKNRYRLRPDEEEILFKYRGLKEQAELNGVSVETVKHGWLKNDNASLFVTNPAYKDQATRELHELKKGLIDWVNSESKPVKKNPKRKGEHLLLIDPADVHIGKLARAFETGEEYNSQIAVKRVHEGIHGIIDNCEGWDIDKIVFIGGNDILHIDTPSRTTTSGTPQDTDGMWYDNFMIACKLYQQVLEALSEIAPVHFIYNPSNHDYTNGFFLAQLIEAYFRGNENITFDVTIRHRKYFQYGKNLIGTTHGDGAKWDLLNGLMANEVPVMWSETKHRYFYIHHVHHKTGKDLVGCTVEALRSPSASDSWHHRKGYTGAPKAIEGYVHNIEHGQVARISHLF